ncbi:MAG TPA: malto-oligosyltrehalose trehalohydrolase, partial [Puia sp.]|nr:malto-oligosyltrehalose trehalohydrolase [Puia sp.]
MNPPQCHNNGCLFRVWAPLQQSLSLQLQDKRIPMRPSPGGYFTADVPEIGDGARYHYIIGNDPYPDPASAYQPEGVFGPSQVVDHRRFPWTDAGWKGQPMEDLIFYELHIGAFTAEGAFDAIIPRLDDLARLGINAIELMPVAAFPGDRNWGYDGVFLYAVQHSYGGPDGLKRLVDAAHRRGISVFLDVVYNHVGGEGNCLETYGPYFSESYRTPWGKAINYDGAWSDGVRDFIIGNVLYWAEHYHLDGVRLDAIHEIYDRNAVTIWDELHAAVKRWEKKNGRSCWLVAESDMNDPRVIQPPGKNGKGLDAQWMDDFHHALFTLLYPKEQKHYVDFGTTEQLAKAMSAGFVHSGEYVKARIRRHGASSAAIGGEHFVVFVQNHDLPGNRPGGERLSVLIGDQALKLAAAAVLLSPYIPMLFMGEEYGEEAPFYFFCEYKDQDTINALREGRKKQLAGYGYTEES